MGTLRLSFCVKFISILLALSLLVAGMEPIPQSGAEQRLGFLVKKFNEMQYSMVISESQKMLNELGEESIRIRGKFFMLLGAAYEKVKNKDAAVENYLLGDMLLDDPVLEGVDFSKMEIYQSTFHGKIIGGRRVYEKVGKRKKKKRFPYLAIAGAAVIVAAVLLLFKKKTKEVPENFEKDEANAIFNSMEWVEIPAGEFLMGDHTGTGDSDEAPVHKVYLDSYKISKYEMTLEQWRRYRYVKPHEWSDYFIGEGDNHPVTQVRFYEAENFCKWVREMTGQNVMLPTEAQWEKAARGTDQRIYPWGNNSPQCGLINFNNCVGITSPVGSNSGDVSFYGVMDMGGNVSELVRDYYDEDYYSVSPYMNPQGPEGGTDDMLMVLRGGNFQSAELRASARESMHRGRFREYMGFRIVMEN